MRRRYASQPTCAPTSSPICVILRTCCWRRKIEQSLHLGEYNDTHEEPQTGVDSEAVASEARTRRERCC
jgi:hypothetical protein